MIQGDQLDLIEVRHFAQLLGDSHLVGSVFRFERLAGDLHVLIVVDREVRTVTRARAKRRDAQDVGDELKPAAVPREDHRTRAREARRLFVHDGSSNRLGHLVLDEAVRPGDAHGVDRVGIADAEQERHTGVGFLLIARADLYFDLRLGRQLRIFHAGQRHAN